MINKIEIILLAGRPRAPVSEEDKLFISLFARTLSWPVVADVPSGMRFDKDASNLICLADQILTTEKAELFMDDEQVISNSEKDLFRRELRNLW